MSVAGSAKRHIEAWIAGQDTDPDLGTAHLANAAWNLFALQEYSRIHPEFDDRPSSLNRNLQVALDIDGVICDFAPAALKRAGVEATYSNAWFPSYKLNRVWKELVADKSFWINLPRMFDPEEMKFEPIAYVTSRIIPIEWTEEWIEKNGFPCNPIIQIDSSKMDPANPGVHPSKLDMLRHIKADVIIEDNYSQFIHLLKAGFPVRLITTPFNKRWNVGTHRITHVNDILL